MTTAAPILIQDLPVYISSKTGEPVTISKSDFLSLFDDLDFKPASEPSITTRLNPDGSPYAYASVNCGSHEQAIEALSQINFTLINNVPDKPVKKIQNLNKSFKELLYFSGKNESNQLFYKKSDFISPPIIYPIQNLSPSYSVYSQHSIMILENEKAAAVGSNKVHQVSHLAPQLFENQTIVSVQNSKDLKIDSFSSAVCGSKYTLYLCNPTIKSIIRSSLCKAQPKTRQFLILEKKCQLHYMEVKMFQLQLTVMELSSLLIRRISSLLTCQIMRKQSSLLAQINLFLLSQKVDTFIVPLQILPKIQTI